MSRQNRHGRSDYIPSDIARQVRQNCGFGCVVCGCPFYDYEHWNPEFADLQTDPSPDGITLCCPNCHRKKGTLISHEQYAACIANPKALEDGYAITGWGYESVPEILLGNVRCSGGMRVIEVNGELVLGFNRPEAPGTPPRLFGRFFDRNETEAITITNNQVACNPNAWDITSKRHNANSWRWVVRSNHRKLDLVLDLHPPNQILIRRLFWQRLGLQIRVNERGVRVGGVISPDSEASVNVATLRDAEIQPILPHNCLLSISQRFVACKLTGEHLFVADVSTSGLYINFGRNGGLDTSRDSVL